MLTGLDDNIVVHFIQKSDLKSVGNIIVDMFYLGIVKIVTTLFVCVSIIHQILVYSDQDGVTVKYKVTIGNFCGNEGDSFNKFVGIPLAECAKECGIRKRCLGLRYHRRYTLCELLSGSNKGPQNDGSCIFIPASDIVVEQDCSQCIDEYKTCNDKTNVCKYKECTDVDKDTWLRGNMRNVGNRIMQRCGEGYNYSECLEDGTWSKTDVCKPLVNVAMGKRASMSSGYRENDFLASFGVDGVLGRAKNFSLQVGMTMESLTEYGRVKELGLNTKFDLPRNTLARYVKTQIYTMNFFHLFEVQVMAV